MTNLMRWQWLMARRLIFSCEEDLGRKLTMGERRDLLKDNTNWDSDIIHDVVKMIAQGRRP